MSKESIGILADAKVKACLDELADFRNKTKTSIISELILNHYANVFHRSAEYDRNYDNRHHFNVSIRDEYYQYLLDDVCPDNRNPLEVAEYIGEWLEHNALMKHERKIKLRAVA